MSTARPLILGLTGSIGMGKSTVAAMLRDEGIPVFDADAEVHRLHGPGGPLVPAIEAAFPGTTGPQGVDRERLAPRVFGDPEGLARLEALVHPAVAQARELFLRRHRDSDLICFDIPLLFEKGGAGAVDKVVVVSASPAVQRERVLQRPGMTSQRFAEILALQTPDAEKRARADHVIETGGSLEETRAQLLGLLARLRSGLAPRAG